MDIAKRVYKVIKWAGYGLFVYFNYETFMLDPKFSSEIFSNRVQFFSATTACIAVPYLFKWILLGKNAHKSDEFAFLDEDD